MKQKKNYDLLRIIALCAGILILALYYLGNPDVMSASVDLTVDPRLSALVCLAYAFWPQLQAAYRQIKHQVSARRLLVILYRETEQEKDARLCRQIRKQQWREKTTVPIR